MQNRLLDAHDSVVYDERWTPPAPGRYTLVAQLRSENYPVQQRVDFALR
jgi:beta-galactosidase/beta-glucuronidase